MAHFNAQAASCISSSLYVSISFIVVTIVSSWPVWKKTLSTCILLFKRFKNIYNAHQICISLTKNTVKYCEILLHFKITVFKCNLFLRWQSWIFSSCCSSLQCPSEIILICWFGMKETFLAWIRNKNFVLFLVLKTAVLLNCFFWAETVLNYFQDSFMNRKF